MSKEVMSTASKKADVSEYAKLLKQLHDKILAQLNSKTAAKSDDFIAKMSSVASS
jgi:hypothetical protein